MTGPWHEIRARPATAEERARARRGSGALARSYGCTLVVAALLPVGMTLLVVAIVAGWLPPQGTTGLIGFSAAAALTWLGFAWVVREIVRFDRRERGRARDREAEDGVEEIEVRGGLAFEIEPEGEEGPLLAIEIGPGSDGDARTLLLQGQWLWDNEVFGAPFSNDDRRDEIFNGLPEPHAFPSDHFVLTRMRRTGYTLGIRVLGRYIAPAGPIEIPGVRDLAWVDARVLGCDVGGLGEAVRAEIERA